MRTLSTWRPFHIRPLHITVNHTAHRALTKAGGNWVRATLAFFVAVVAAIIIFWPALAFLAAKVVLASVLE